MAEPSNHSILREARAAAREGREMLNPHDPLPPVAPIFPQPAVGVAPATVMALVVRSPWAQEIASGEKVIEYRSWPVKFALRSLLLAATRLKAITRDGTTNHSPRLPWTSPDSLRGCTAGLQC